MANELEDIIVKSHNLFMKYGIKSVTMDDVARELGISKKTLYLHVKDKNDLVEKMFEFEKDCAHKKFEFLESNDFNAIDQLFEADKMFLMLLKDHNPAAFYDLKKYYPVIYTKLTQIRRTRISDFFRGNIAKGISEGLYRPELNGEIIAKLHVSRIEGVIDGDVLTVEEFTSGKWIKELLSYHIRGLATPKGIEYFESKLNDYNSQF